jgi:hypothetical protein
MSNQPEDDMARQIDAGTQIPFTETEKRVWRRVFEEMIERNGVEETEEMLYRGLKSRADRGVLRDPRLRRKLAEMEAERRNS